MYLHAVESKALRPQSLSFARISLSMFTAPRSDDGGIERLVKQPSPLFNRFLYRPFSLPYNEPDGTIPSTRRPHSARIESSSFDSLLGESPLTPPFVQLLYVSATTLNTTSPLANCTSVPHLEATSCPYRRRVPFFLSPKLSLSHDTLLLDPLASPPPSLPQ